MPEIFSRDDLLAILGDEDGGTMSELLAIFESESRRLVHEIVAAAGRGDEATVAHAAHRLKGVAGNVGGRAALEHAASIEVAARRSDHQEVARLVATLDVEVDTLRTAFNGYVSALRTRVDRP